MRVAAALPLMGATEYSSERGGEERVPCANTICIQIQIKLHQICSTGDKNGNEF